MKRMQNQTMPVKKQTWRDKATYVKVKCRARVPFVTQESLFVNENLIL